jgi:hypothetical protein
MIVTILEYLAWIISAALALWMVQDAVRVGREHDEEFLTTSIEGTDELLAVPGAAEVLSPTEDKQ